MNADDRARRANAATQRACRDAHRLTDDLAEHAALDPRPTTSDGHAHYWAQHCLAATTALRFARDALDALAAETTHLTDLTAAHRNAASRDDRRALERQLDGATSLARQLATEAAAETTAAAAAVTNAANYWVTDHSHDLATTAASVAADLAAARQHLAA